MMNFRFISVPKKLIFFITMTLCIIAVGFSALSIYRLHHEIQEYQYMKQQQGQQQLLLHHELFTSELRTWLESFSGLINLSDQNDFSSLAIALEQQVDALQFNFNVDGVWLFNQRLEPLYSSNNAPKYITRMARNVLQQQVPYNTIYCEEKCQQIILVPVLNKRAQIGVVALSSSLVNIIYGLKDTLKSEVTIMSYPKQDNTVLADGNFISSSNPKLTNKVFAHLHNIPLKKAISLGERIDIDENKYFLTLIPLSNSQEQYYIALIDNVSNFIEARDNYRNQFIISMVIVFFLLGALSYWLSSPFTRRLLNLSSALPLLAEKKFDQFREKEITKKRFFSDELDVLVKSANDLSFELERLNLSVEQKTRELENIAMYDILTGLPNRNMLNFQLRKALEKLKSSSHQIAVFFLDLDDFKKVNDSHGHAEGDDLLIEASKRLKGCLNKIDLVCRFGGDEFVIVIEDVKDQAQVTDVADAIIEAFKAPISIGSSLFYVSTSIGIVLTSLSDVSAADLIRQSDIAMYEAKANGGAQYYIYHAEMYKRVAQRVMIEGEVRQALELKQFSISLQPQISSQNYQVIGFEALLRWKHPQRGMVAPDDFIPVLENSAYMVELGYWVIRHCFELTGLLITQPGLSKVRVAINLSAIQFMDPNLVPFLKNLLHEFNISSQHFELEITEQTVVKDVDKAVLVMEQLKLLGFSFAIDDFGTGYSSLSYLKRMPIDVIKIDKSFVDGMLENHADYQIIMSTISMVKNLGLTVVAEGVESSAQLHSLAQHQCDMIQGYYFSKPIPEHDLDTFLPQFIEDGYWKSEINKIVT